MEMNRVLGLRPYDRSRKWDVGAVYTSYLFILTCMQIQDDHQRLRRVDRVRLEPYIPRVGLNVLTAVQCSPRYFADNTRQ